MHISEGSQLGDSFCTRLIGARSMLARRVRDALLLGLVFGGLSGTFAARAAQEVRAYAVAFYAEEKTATGGTVSAAKEFSSADGSPRPMQWERGWG